MTLPLNSTLSIDMRRLQLGIHGMCAIVGGGGTGGSLTLLLAVQFSGLMAVGFQSTGIRAEPRHAAVIAGIVGGALLGAISAMLLARYRRRIVSHYFPPTALLLPNLFTVVAWFIYGTAPGTIALFTLMTTVSLFLGAIASNLPSLTPTTISNRLGWVTTAALTVTYAVTFGVLNVLQLQTSHLGYEDSGFLAEALWNTLHGRFMHTNNLIHPMIGDHFSPIWLALVPLFALYPHHETLCIASALTLAVCIPLSYVLARRVTQSVGVGIGFALAVYLYPAMTLENSSFTYGFQTELLALPLLLGACCFIPHNSDALTRSQKRWLLALLILALMCKENIALPVTMVGVYLAWRDRPSVFAVSIIAMGLLTGYLATAHILPAIRGASPFHNFDQLYGHLGHSMPEVVLEVAKRPGYLLSQLTRSDTLTFITLMLLPLAFLGLWRFDILLIASASMFFLTIAQLEQLRCIKFHYKISMLPFIIFASITGFKKAEIGLSRWLLQPVEAIRQGLMVTLLSIAVMSAYMVGAGPLTRQFDSDHYKASGQSILVHHVKAALNRDAVLFTSTRIGAMFTDRPHLFIVAAKHIPAPSPDVILVDTSSNWGGRAASQRTVERYLNDANYTLIGRVEKTYLIVRRDRDNLFSVDPRSFF